MPLFFATIIKKDKEVGHDKDTSVVMPMDVS